MASNQPARSLARAAASLLIGLSLALSAPAPVHAEQRDTDIICGLAASDVAFPATDLPDVACKAAIVVGQDGTVYFERDADAELKIASITKVMTAIVALENAELTDTVTVDHAAATVGESSADLKEGDTMPLSVALKALMMPSGNDAAMAIASSVGAVIDFESDDPYQTFIDAMNDTAAKLGMTHSVFANPHGLDFGGWEGDFHSTARDVATMFAHIMKNEEFRALEEDADNKIAVTGADGEERAIELIDRNEIRGKSGHIGGKTGGTYEALQCFVGGFSREPGGEVYTVTLGSESGEQRWADTLALADWYYDHVVSYPLVQTERTTAEGAPLVGRVTHADWSDKTVDVAAADPEASVELFSLAGDVELAADVHAVSGDVSKGQELGTLKLVQGGEELASVALVAAESQRAPGPLEWLLVQFDRAVRFLTGEPGQAAMEELFEVAPATALDAV